MHGWRVAGSRALVRIQPGPCFQTQPPARAADIALLTRAAPATSAAHAANQGSSAAVRPHLGALHWHLLPIHTQEYNNGGAVNLAPHVPGRGHLVPAETHVYMAAGERVQCGVNGRGPRGAVRQAGGGWAWVLQASGTGREGGRELLLCCFPNCCKTQQLQG